MGAYALLIAEKGQSKVETWEVRHNNCSTSLMVLCDRHRKPAWSGCENKGTPGAPHREKSWEALWLDPAAPTVSVAWSPSLGSAVLRVPCQVGICSDHATDVPSSRNTRNTLAPSAKTQGITARNSSQVLSPPPHPCAKPCVSAPMVYCACPSC